MLPASLTNVTADLKSVDPKFAHLTPAELAVFRKLNSPAKIQQFLDQEIGYNKEPDGETCYSPRNVLKRRVAHCMEGALLAAMALRYWGHPPLLLDLEAIRDSDHVLAVYRLNGHWGSVAKSDYTGLRSREPVYATIRELAMSYFEDYYNLRGEKSLRAFSRPVNLSRFDRSVQWMTTFEDVWTIPEHLVAIPHTKILTKAMEHSLAMTDVRTFQAGRVGGACAPLLDLSKLKKPR
jgi:hypothetical protein